MPCAYTPCRCHERMGNDFYFLPIERCLYEGDIPPLPAHTEASVRENFCSLGHDCLCDRIYHAPDPKCNHYRRTSHGTEVPKESITA